MKSYYTESETSNDADADAGITLNQKLVPTPTLTLTPVLLLNQKLLPTPTLTPVLLLIRNSLTNTNADAGMSAVAFLNIRLVALIVYIRADLSKIFAALCSLYIIKNHKLALKCKQLVDVSSLRAFKCVFIHTYIHLVQIFRYTLM